MNKRITLIVAILGLAVASVAVAKAPTTSLRPDARPGSAIVAEQPAATPLIKRLFASPIPRPRPRPSGTVVAAAVVAPATPPIAEPVVTQEVAVPLVPPTPGAAVARSVRPDKRPRNFARIVRAAVRGQPSTAVTTSRAGSICGDPAIKGKAIAPIAGRLSGCGVANPVRVTSVDGVVLSTPASINCNTARALKKWVSSSVIPAVGRMGGGVKSLRVVAHYSCRTRNNVRGAKISEHGRGNAIDIAAINLNNGTSLTVLRGWRDRTQGPVLKKVHAGACGTFGTVLGPNSDRYHQDHFHFDVARHRSGAYCR